MVLRHEGEGMIAIGQPAHAWLSGQLARAWGSPGFGPVVPREDVCLAAEQHDLGMADWDGAPTLNRDTGWPHSFLEMPVVAHLELWSAAPSRALTQSRYAALLTSLHGTGLYRSRDMDSEPPPVAAAIRDYLAGQRAFQQQVIGWLADDPAYAEHADEAVIDRNRRLMAAWDWMSLGLCMDVLPTRAEDVPARDGQATVELERAPDGRVRASPWPFAAEAVTVRCEGRLLSRPFEREEEMRETLARAPWRTLSFELVPAA
jgi:Protein of unknown function (DUF3891)